MNYIFVDLDDTIINTSAAKTRFFEALAELSKCEIGEIDKSYQLFKNEIGKEGWIEEFTTALANQTGIVKNQIKDLFFKSFEQASVDEDLLIYLKHIEAKKILFTYGNEKLQNKKLDLLDLRGNFDEIIITSEEKAEYFLNLVSKIDSKNIAIIDDNRKTLKTIKSKNPVVRTYTKEQLFEFVNSYRMVKDSTIPSLGGSL